MEVPSKLQSSGSANMHVFDPGDACFTPTQHGVLLHVPAGVLSYLSSRAVSSADASFLATARRSDKLVVPTAGALLMPASRVVHMGSAGGSMTAARLLGRTDPQHLLLAHPQLPEHVCRWGFHVGFADWHAHC